MVDLGLNKSRGMLVRHDIHTDGRRDKRNECANSLNLGESLIAKIHFHHPADNLQIHLSSAHPQSPYLFPHMPSRPYRMYANPISSRRLYDNANPQNSANAVFF